LAPTCGSLSKRPGRTTLSFLLSPRHRAEQSPSEYERRFASCNKRFRRWSHSAAELACVPGLRRPVERRVRVAAFLHWMGAIGTFSGLRNFAGFALHFRECSSNEFTIHLIITSKNHKTGLIDPPGALGQGRAVTDRYQNSRRLRPSEERSETLPVMETLQGMTDMLHNQERKSKGDNP